MATSQVACTCWIGVTGCTQDFQSSPAFIRYAADLVFNTNYWRAVAANIFWWKGWWKENKNGPLGSVVACFLAEAVGFEPTEDSHPRQFSRLLHSTALPRFQAF